MRWFSSKLLLPIALAYPFVIYFWGDQISPATLAACIILLLVIRAAVHYRKRTQGFSECAMSLTIALMMGGLCFWDSEKAALFYPVMMSLSFAFLLGWSLLYPPTLIEKFARLIEGDLDAHGIEYTYKVTVVWLIFSLLNAAISLFTVLINDPEIWLLYNAFISYALMGLLMGGEYLFRGYYKKTCKKASKNRMKNRHE